MRAYENLAWVHKRRGDYDDALREDAKAIETDPRSSAANFDRAVCYLHLGKDADALADLKRSCELGYQEDCRRYDEAVGQQ